MKYETYYSYSFSFRLSLPPFLDFFMRFSLAYICAEILFRLQKKKKEKKKKRVAYTQRDSNSHLHIYIHIQKSFKVLIYNL